jgi:hypothetical protein
MSQWRQQDFLSITSKITKFPLTETLGKADHIIGPHILALHVKVGLISARSDELKRDGADHAQSGPKVKRAAQA